ncbi:MAG: hypothetical protein HY812_12210 [Planctomycetes bacterium]|nr:hypothetical protein [Planctomycetota bacterium]
MLARCAFLVLFAAASFQGTPGHKFVDAECALEVELPGSDWVLSEQHSQVTGKVAVRIYAPGSDIGTRFTVVQLPAALAGSGLKARAEQLRAVAEEEISVTAGEIGGVAAERMEYAARGFFAIEYGVWREGLFQVIQVSAPAADWEDAEKGAALRAIFDSVRFVPRAAGAAPAGFDATSPEEVRALRGRAGAESRPFAIRSHDLALDVEPAAGRLACRDRFVVEALADGVESLELVQSQLDIDAITAAGGSLPFEADGAGAAGEGGGLRIQLQAPLERGQIIELVYQAHADDFFFTMEQKLVAEVEVFGQVREHSSFSSHVIYYPIDRWNDASVSISITVPEGYTAVSGGEAVPPETRDGRITFAYRTEERRIRQLPFGFAIGRYEAARGRTEGGLDVEVYFPAGAEERGAAYLDVALRAGALFQRIMGPLPWKRVAICVVDPERKETGVSLPGQILLSGGFFKDLEGVEPDGSRLNDPAMMGYLLVPDELSHQWNFYAAPLPNELAEGVSTYTNLLFVEQEGGHAEYLEGVGVCAGAYLDAVAPEDDVALANPRLYQSDAYRQVGFCKVPAILHGLRQRLGDEAFFAAWKRAFTTLREPEEAYAEFQAAFEEASGQDLRSFFDGWFFSAGYALVAVRFAATEEHGAPAVEVTLRQTQNTGPFEIDCEVEVETAGGEKVRFPAALRAVEETFTWPLPALPVKVTVDPDGTALLRVAGA